MTFTFKDYWLLNRQAIRQGIKISGIILNVIIFLFIVGAFFFENYQINNPLTTFLLCFVAGNAFAAFVITLGVNSKFRGVKRTFSFYNSIPEKTKKRYNLGIYLLSQNSSYHFKEFEIMSELKEEEEEDDNNDESEKTEDSKLNNRFLFDCLDDRSARIILVHDVSTISNFYKYSLKLEKMYPKQGISLSGYGTVKTISRKNWKKITDNEIDQITSQLIEIATTEGFLKDNSNKTTNNI